jgi:hypothetical protein
VVIFLLRWGACIYQFIRTCLFSSMLINYYFVLSTLFIIFILANYMGFDFFFRCRVFFMDILFYNIFLSSVNLKKIEELWCEINLCLVVLLQLLRFPNKFKSWHKYNNLWEKYNNSCWMYNRTIKYPFF